MDRGLLNVHELLKLLTYLFEKRETPFILKASPQNSLKPYKTIDQLIDELCCKTDHALTFTDLEKEEAKEFFTYNNYYSFSIFRKMLPWDSQESFSFTQCRDLYNFDQFLREQLNRFTGAVELMVRATLVKSLCESYKGSYDSGVFYLDKNIYVSRERARKVLNAFNRRISKSKSLSVMHHKKKKQNCFPFWLLVEELTFGELFHFLSTLKNEYRAHWIEESFDKSYKSQFSSWVRTIQFLRNSCAHYSRIYGNFFMTSRPQLLKEDTRKAGIKKNDNATLFANMLTLKNVLQYASQNTVDAWNEFLDNIELQLKHHQDIIFLGRMGFPSNWKECLRFE